MTQKIPTDIQRHNGKNYGNHDDAQLNSSYFLARHVAVYKYDQLGLALREVQINGFTQQGRLIEYRCSNVEIEKNLCSD